MKKNLIIFFLFHTNYFINNQRTNNNGRIIIDQTEQYFFIMRLKLYIYIIVSSYCFMKYMIFFLNYGKFYENFNNLNNSI